MVSGYRAYSPAFYGKDDFGFVHLTGYIKKIGTQNVVAGEMFAVLPTGFQPKTSYVGIPVSLAIGTISYYAATMQINIDEKIVLGITNGVNDYGGVVLDGVAFANV